ncbi:isochorismatase family protein [Herbaspirillum sp. RTI4]|uniref:isochorismatase family protein n=1 Tax=Herbaspirillum sp. RTI4 TaxID=3048640 RepID=UPI002AB3F224|nr:isochorismatase family protein [Herbaspirillum sp. RTI4]MDY7580032.1 isochorismatase family protein [Herbaspirillum sp. RTI4]MEA9982985.1 isochorismatase family protein [Herbaspirillum sp. RTI4]
MKTATPHQPKRALILIDIQNEYVTGNMRIEFPPLDVSLPNIAKAIEAAKAAGIPLVLVQQMAPASSPIFAEGSFGGELHSVVSKASADLLVQKTLPSALADTELGEWLTARQIDTLVVAGYMSQNCNESTIRQAAHEGWDVEYLHDASGAVSYRNSMGLLTAEAMHHATNVVMQSRFAAVMGTDQWIALIQTQQSPVRETLYQSYKAAQA